MTMIHNVADLDRRQKRTGLSSHFLDDLMVGGGGDGDLINLQA